MKTLRPLLLHLLLCLTGHAIPVDSIPANNANIEYAGRIDFTDPLAPRFSYSGVSVRARFQGTAVSVNLQNDGTSNIYNVIVDGAVTQRITLSNGEQTVALASGLSNTTHEIEIYKLTESTYGKTRFRGFVVDAGKNLVPLTNPRSRVLAFIGDSITCGSGIEGASDSTQTNTNQNHYLSYAAITSRNFNARHIVAARSGVGLYANYSSNPTGLESPNNMKNYYERMHWNDAAPLYGFSPTPDVICVNLGTNDFSVGVNEAAFEQAYHDFIDIIQAKNPGVDIVCLVGPMVSGYNLGRLRIIVPRVATTANAQNNGRVFHFEMSQQGEFGTGSQNHPNVPQHAKNAAELTTFISGIKSWPLATAPASTMGHWRFEATPGLLADSGSNGLTLSTQGTAPTAYPITTSGPASAFPSVIPQTGATNSGAANSGTPGGGNFSRSDGPAFTLTNFTIEAFVHRSQAPVGTQYLASQYDFNTGAQRSWGFGVAGTSPPSGLSSGELFLNLSNNGANGVVVGSGLIVGTGVDFYVAASVEASNPSAGVTFHLKNLTNGGTLTTATRANPVGTVFNSTGDFLIGGYNGGGNRWSGIIDDVRLSNAVLAAYQLLVTQAGPVPVEKPVIDPASGSYTDPVSVTLTCVTSGAEIRYTLDGSPPTSTSTLYTAPFAVAVTTTIKAQAFKAATPDSEVATATFNFLSYPLLGTLKPPNARTITNSNWSVGGETVDRDYTVFANYKDWLGPLGIKRIRQQAGWFKCEKVVGVYDWAWLDECVDGALSQGVQPWLETNYGNPIYPGGGGSGLGAGLPTSTTALAAWDNWVTALVDRYKDRVNEWEVWNEPDNSGGQVTAEAYAAFYIRTAEIIRARQPTARLYALAVTGPSNGATSYVGKFFTALQTANKLHLVTAITAHAYPYNPDTSQAGFLAMKDWVNTNFYPSGGIEVRQGESGACSQFQTSFALSNINWTELMQSKWNTRRLLGDLGHDIPSSIFAIIDMKYYGTTWNNKGLLKANEQLAVDRPKLAYFGVRNIAAVFDDSLTRITSFSHTANTAEALRVFGYNKTATGKTVASIWFSGGGLPSDTNNYTDVDFTLTPANITDPVWVDMRDGTVRSIPTAEWSRSGNTCTFNNVPVYDSPILIADRSAIPIASLIDNWKQTHFNIPQQGDESISGDSADPDRDDSPNLLEYALGSLPLQNSSTARPVRGIDPMGQLTLTFDRTADPALLYQVQGSGNLSDWSAVWSSTSVQNTPGIVTATDTAELPRNLRFLRLKVTSTNP
jgi:lysophospholipase L1-like esterase